MKIESIKQLFLIKPHEFSNETEHIVTDLWTNILTSDFVLDMSFSTIEI